MAEKEKNRKRIGWIFWTAFALVGAALLFIYFRSSELVPWEGVQQVFTALAVVFAAMVASKIVNSFIVRRLKRIAKSKKIKVDVTRFRIAENLVSLIIYTLAVIFIVYSIPELKSLSFSLLAGVGFAAIVIGFAAQEVVSNLLSGVLIAIFQPFRVGDRMMFEGEFGTVEDITLRHTVIKTWKNIRLVVPNSAINKATITNYSLKEEKILETLEIGISYDSDIDRARKIMLEEAKKHPDFFDPREKTEISSKKDSVKVRVIELGEYFVKLRLYFWAKDKPAAFRMSCDLLESIKKRFDREGIEIPFPYRTLVYKKDLEKKK